MKKIFASAVFAASCLTAPHALAATAPPPDCFNTIKGSNNPGVFLGVTYAFDAKDSLGVTLGVTSSRRDGKGVLAGGVSYYPTTGSIGIPLGVGYQKSHGLILGGYDFLLKSPVVSGAYTNTSKDKTVEDLESCRG